MEGDELAGYVLWNRGLTEREAGQWDAFVADANADDGLLARFAGSELSAQSEASRNQILSWLDRRLFKVTMKADSD